MSDAARTLALVATFATLAAIHVSITFGLCARRAPLLGAAALLIPPLAPYLALRGAMRGRAIAWLCAAAAYAASLVAAMS
ncbi:MAG TPA: hypothetical protein VGM56_33580 [Byssovorax sp.]|jgi:hypothetical protein